MIILDLPGGFNLISGGATNFGSAVGMPLFLERIAATSLAGPFVVIWRSRAALVRARDRAGENRRSWQAMRGNSRRLPFRPEVVFLDIGLPGKNSHEVARQIREPP